MSIGKQIKEEIVREFAEKIAGSRTVIVTSARGLGVLELNELRDRVHEGKGDILMIKNTLASRAFQKAGIEGIASLLEGEIFYALSTDDPVGVSKIMVNFATTHVALKIRGGIIDKKIVNFNEINKWASLPPRQVLLQKLAVGIKIPISNLILVLNGPLRKMVLTLEEIRKQKAKSG